MMHLPALIKLEIQRWIIENVDPIVVPADEGNGEGLVYNLLKLLENGDYSDKFNYKCDEYEYLCRKFGEFSLDYKEIEYLCLKRNCEE